MLDPRGLTGAIALQSAAILMHVKTTLHGLVWMVVGAALAGCPADDEPADTDGGESSSTTGASGTTSTSDSATASTNSASTSIGDTEPDQGSSESGEVGSSGGATSGSSTSGGSSSSTGSIAACGETQIVGADSAVAVRYGDLPPIGMTGSTTVGAIDEDALWLRIASFPVDCKDPRGDSQCEQGVEKWHINMAIPVELQMPGEYSFEDLGVFMVASDGMCGGAMSSTSGGGGGTPEGTVFIDSIGPDGIVGCIVTDDKNGFDPNGSFEAVHCSAE